MRDRATICLVTDRTRMAAGEEEFTKIEGRLVDLARAAAAAGVDLLQVRERDLETSRLVDLVSRILGVVRDTPMRVVVNDRLDVALACSAHGVHLRADSVSPAAARSIAPPGFLVGRSVHAVGEAVEHAADVDYLVAGTVFPSLSKPASDRLLGVSGLAQIAHAVRVPVLAIGGVSPANLPQVAAAGAAGIAAIGLFLTSAAIAETVASVRGAFDIAKAAS